MKTPCVVIDNFLEDPMGARNFGLRANLAVPHRKNGTVLRGLRSPFLGEIFPKLYSEITFKISDVLGINPEDFEFRTRYQVTNGTWRPWVHKDNCFCTVLIYLNEVTPQNSGTNLYLPKPGVEHQNGHYNLEKRLGNADLNYRSSEEYESKRLDNNSYYNCDVSVENVFNRAFFILDRRYHSADSFFGSSLHDSRMTIACFVHEK